MGVFDAVVDSTTKDVFLAWAIIGTFTLICVVIALVLAFLGKGDGEGKYKIFMYITASLSFVFIVLSTIWWWGLWDNAGVVAS